MAYAAIDRVYTADWYTDVNKGDQPEGPKADLPRKCHNDQGLNKPINSRL